MPGSRRTGHPVTGLGIGETVRRSGSSGRVTFLVHGRGRTRALTNSTGAVQTQYAYAPFGVTTATGASSTNPFQFTGRENDNTGLYYYRARYFNPTLQRFISEDPIGFGGGQVNLYSYVGNRPLGATDPSGTSEFYNHGIETYTD